MNATQDEIEEAARTAHLMDLIASLPDGFDTQIGERGLKLSGGSEATAGYCQNVFFEKNPPILILDEATSALDTETEAIIQEALNDLSKDRTTLIIAHRLGTIKKRLTVFSL
ncbi:hypothetical protein GCM10020331_091100 [Ectobacillus funiculus]